VKDNDYVQARAEIDKAVAAATDGYREEDRHAYDVSRIDLTALAREEIREYFRQAAPDRPADGDPGVLKAVLLPDHNGDEKRYRKHLDRVRHRYAAVQHTSARNPRLHDEPARFFGERLRSQALREQDWLRELNDRAVKTLCRQLDKFGGYHLRLEDLCEDHDYVDAAVKVARHLFWRDEDEAWPWWTARYVEGLAYSSRLREGLLEEATSWRPHLGQRGRKRLTVLQDAERYSWRSDEQQMRRKLLEDDAERGWLVDQRIENRHQQERQAIRLWSAADAFRRADRHDQALECLRLAQQRSSDLKGEISSKVAALVLDVGYQFYLMKDYRKGWDASSIAVAADSTSARAWRELGSFYTLLKDYEKAIEHHKKAIEINPKDHDAWRILGTDYGFLKDYEKAIEHYKKAIEINAKDHDAWRELAWNLIFRTRYDEAVEAIQRCLAIHADDSMAWSCRGYLDMIVGERRLLTAAFPRFAEHVPGVADRYSVLALYHDLAGEWERAGRYYREALLATHSETPPPSHRQAGARLSWINRHADVPDASPTLGDAVELFGGGGVKDAHRQTPTTAWTRPGKR
jgi:tetratricopeptide (TPR) repeat protein